MIIVTAPKQIEDYYSECMVFLAGSIEMGAAENWQEKVISALRTEDCVIFNPRRDDWDSSWVQSPADWRFFGQVNWELYALERADLIMMYFDPMTKSPISLLEFGLWARSGKLIVCCPDGFWRKGNVDIVSMRYQIQITDNLPDLIKETKQRISQRNEAIKECLNGQITTD